MGREGHTLDAPVKPPRAAPPAIPPLRRVRTTLARVWPLASWLAAIAAAGWLYPRAETHGEALAWPEVVEIGVTPQVAGRLASMPLEIGVEVHDGDLAATLDTTDIDERLRVARAEAARRPGDGGAGRRVVLVEGKGGASVGVAGDPLEDQRVHIEIDRVTAEQKADRGELAALVPEIDRVRPLVEKHLATPDRLDEMLVKRGLLDKRIGARSEELEQLRKRLDVSTGDALRLGALQLAELERQRTKFQILAPSAGHVSSIAHRTGEWIEAGASVAQILVQRPGRMTAYIVDRQVTQVSLGMSATLRARSHVGPAIEGKVLRLGPSIEEVPYRLRFVPNVVQWGRRVTIEISPDVEVVPGEVYSVRFHS